METGLLTADQVTAVLVTRGDVNMSPIIELLPYKQVVIWDNSTRPHDVGAYGRYLAIEEADNEVIYFQDDDCLVRCHDELMRAYDSGSVIANMDKENATFLDDSVLLGWGSLFDRDLPRLAFEKFERVFPGLEFKSMKCWGADWIFPAMTPNAYIDCGYEHLPHYDAPNRLWKQDDFAWRRDLWIRHARLAREHG